MSEKLYKVGMYIRLSLENTAYKGKDSQSIENQQALLTNFISVMPGWVETRTYIDNGASGGNFNRQGFQDMMADVRSGVINLVLVKDLSRFGRNYLESGHYLEEELPKYKCRFVALDDGIDTETGENDIMPVLNALNDYYLKNLSDRVKLVLTAKAKDGQKLGSVPYGYIRDPENYKRMTVDKNAAEVVRRIFEMRLNGDGCVKIAEALNKDGIPSPRLYASIHHGKSSRNASGFWIDCTVRQILRNEAYAGHSVQNVRTCVSYRKKKAVIRPEDEWIRIEDTHEAIIPPEKWQQVQAVNMRRREPYEKRRKPNPGIFSGILYCSGCGKTLNSNCNRHHKATVFWYYCRGNKASGGTMCSSHSIGEATLKKLLLGHIKEQAEQIAFNRSRVLEKLQSTLIGAQKTSRTDNVKRQKEIEQRLRSTETQTEKLYEDKVMGLISGDTFSTLSQKLEKERQEYEAQLKALLEVQKQSANKLSDIDRWVKLIEEKATLTEVDKDLLDCLVERIEIGEDVLVNGVKTKDVRIFYKFVGLIESDFLTHICPF